MSMTESDTEQVVRLTATLMASTAALALRWAGNAMLALVCLMAVIQYASGVETMLLGLAATPSAFWIASWVARRAQGRIADRVVASMERMRRA